LRTASQNKRKRKKGDKEEGEVKAEQKRKL
jgi:hypothetical protein